MFLFDSALYQTKQAKQSLSISFPRLKKKNVSRVLRTKLLLKYLLLTLKVLSDDPGIFIISMWSSIGFFSPIQIVGFLVFSMVSGFYFFKFKTDPVSKKKKLNSRLNTLSRELWDLVSYLSLLL